MNSNLQNISNHIISRKVAKGLSGCIRVPGDKSMSHRAVMFSSLANGESCISGLLEGDDVLATLQAFKQLGVQVDGPYSHGSDMQESANGKFHIKGVGMRGLKESDEALDMGNSGTAMRLLTGILAAQNFSSKLIGDESLSARPMRRVTVPLSSMGARCLTDDNGCPPIHIRGVEKLEPIAYKLPVASAQIKSAVLLAGLYANGATSVTVPAPTRDHTERMLQAFDYECRSEKVNDQVTTITLAGGGELSAADIDIPADISSSAFFLVAASIIPGSDIVLEHVGVNPTRTGIIDVLKAMGANISLSKQRLIGGEPVADIRVKYKGLKGTEIDPKIVPLAIDEFPIICIAAASAVGETLISGAQELRHKESDRISAMVSGLRAIGVDVDEFKDGMRIFGKGEKDYNALASNGKDGSDKDDSDKDDEATHNRNQPKEALKRKARQENKSLFTGGQVDSFFDHRVAMSFAIAGAMSCEDVLIKDAHHVTTSFPNFVELANQLGLCLSKSS